MNHNMEQQDPTAFAKINTDGTCEFNWPLIMYNADLWEHGTNDQAINICKLLSALKPADVVIKV